MVPKQKRARARLTACLKCSVPARPSSRPPARRLSSRRRAPRLPGPAPPTAPAARSQADTRFPLARGTQLSADHGHTGRHGATPTAERPRSHCPTPRLHPVAYLLGRNAASRRDPSPGVRGLWDPAPTSSSRLRRSAVPALQAKTRPSGLTTPPSSPSKALPLPGSSPGSGPTPGGLSAPGAGVPECVGSHWLHVAAPDQAWSQSSIFESTVCATTRDRPAQQGRA